MGALNILLFFSFEFLILPQIDDTHRHIYKTFEKLQIEILRVFFFQYFVCVYVEREKAPLLINTVLINPRSRQKLENKKKWLVGIFITRL